MRLNALLLGLFSNKIGLKMNLAYRVIFFLLNVLCLLTVSVKVYASDVARLSVNEGLAQSYVKNVLVDKSGFLWIATEGGLNTYDGHAIQDILGPDNILTDSQIGLLYQDSLENIWISGIRFGLLKYSPDTHVFTTILESPKITENTFEQEIFSMLEVGDGNSYWLGRVKDLALLNSETGEITSIYTFPKSNDVHAVRSLVQVGQYLFIGTTEGVYAMDTKTQKVIEVRHLNKQHHDDQANIKSFLLDGNTLWVGAVQGLYQIDVTKVTQFFSKEVDELPAEEVVSDLNIWKINKSSERLRLATNQGIFDFYPQDNQLIKNDQIEKSGFDLSDPSIVDMIEDEHGAMWVATRTDGAYYLPDHPYRFYNYHSDNIRGDGLSNINVWFVQEYGGYLWLGTGDGITRLNMMNYHSKVYLQGYLADEYANKFSVHQIEEYQGKLYLGTLRGVFVFDPETEQVERLTQSNIGIGDYLYDVRGGMYVNDDGKLYLNSARFGFFSIDLNTHEVSPIYLDLPYFDQLYVGGFFDPIVDKPTSPLFMHKGELYRLLPDNTTELLFKVQNDRIRDTVALQGYVVDKNNILWVSFSSTGLFGIDLETYQVVHQIDTRNLDMGTLLYDLMLDEEGNIWMSSHRGILRFNPITLHFQKFNIDDGLHTNEFNAYAAKKLKDGRIVYGSIKGVTAFLPELFSHSKKLVHQVNITSIELMSRDIAYDEAIKSNTIQLEHDDIGLEIGFSAMSFKYQDRINFEYQVGDAQPVITTKNTVSFARLSPGNHRFSIRAQDPLTGVFTAPSELEINVNYPPWRSPAFYAIYIILVIMLASFWFYHRHKIQRQLIDAHNESIQSESRLKMALEGSNSGVWEWLLEDGTVYQPRLVDELGYDEAQVSLDFYLSKLHPEDRNRFRIDWLEFLSTERGYFEASYRVRHSNGHWRWYKDFGKVISWVDGLPQQVAGTYTNITHERALENNARLFGSAFEHTRDWVLLLSPSFEIVAVNKALRDAFNFECERVSARRLSMGLTASQRGSYLKVFAKLQPGEHYQAEELLATKDGIQHACLVKATAISGDQGKVENFVIVITDISAQKVAEEELRLLSNYDPLTKLPNRALLIDRIEHATEISRRHKSKLALLFIDLDKFKKINDTLGREVADKVLISIAQRIKLVLREQDTVARLSGDEFTVLVEDLQHADEAAIIAEKLCAVIAEPQQFEHHSISITASIGIAVFPGDANTGANLLKAADIAMFHAKKRDGNNYQFFRQEMNLKVQRLLQLESELKYAQMNNELLNYYQPIMCANSGKIKGFETLIRWQKNDQFINPDQFIPVAESTGLITAITLATLERALSDLQTWQLFLPECYVSINLSAKDFEHTDLANRIIAACEKYNIDCQYLVLELTESTLMSDTQQSLTIMQKLKHAGCKLYVDDFGTGYSSLTYIKRFPVDVIKIDKSFVEDIGVDENDEAIIHSTLALAHSLGKECVAEGVETKEQAEFLSMLGCAYLQGFLFSRPMPKKDVLKYVKGYKPKHLEKL